MIFEIAQFDNDYNAFCGYVYINAHNKSDAEQWCRENTWSGHSYMINRQDVHTTERVLQDLTLNDTNFAC